MKYQIINFATPKSATLTEPEIKKRLLDFAKNLKENRARKILGLPDISGMTEMELEKALDDLGWSYDHLCHVYDKMQLTSKERKRITDRSEKLHVAGQIAVVKIGGPERHNDRQKLIHISEGVDGMRISADMIDAVAAQLHADMPWFDRITAHIMRRGRSCAAAEEPFTVGPIIIDGGPGLGKTRFAQALGGLLDIPSLRIDLGHEGVMGLAGVERGWGSARPGIVVEGMISRGVANPIVIIDELARGTAQVDTNKGPAPGTHARLLAMTDAETAGAWRCPFYGVEFDLRRVSWIMTSNGLDGVPPALISRCKLFRIDQLSRDHLRHAALVMSRGRLDPDVAEIAAASVWRAAGSRRMDLRHVSRAIDRAVEMQDFGRMFH